MKMNRIYSVFIILFMCILSCSKDTPYISSKDLAGSEVVKVLGEHIALKSPIIEAHYLLYDVNRNTRSIPGATDRNYKIYLKVAPDDVEKWISSVHITSFPRSSDWARDIIPEEVYNRIMADTFTYAVEENGYTLDYFVNKNTGEILMHYVQH